ncbi:MAG: archease [Bacteroidia bacterium]|nr:archease [Bacteroidia bacterium]MBT8274993.1 archease [Bacteroidia bacterium]NNF30115.1 archease [Flavobacteriaceae bacterium]NNK55522.1 archease [Flavobacteriaceae bacterium]NNM08117.1 archease [Flavobacteriaceae bacterium]
MNIEYLPHTADIRMKIQGSSMEELFIHGIQGMNNILKQGFCDPAHQYLHKTSVETASSGYTNLLIDFLSDVLSYTYTENVMFCQIEFIRFTENLVEAQMLGAPIESFDEEIKAVTYHEANIKKNTKGNWETIVVFDI